MTGIPKKSKEEQELTVVLLLLPQRWGSRASVGAIAVAPLLKQAKDQAVGQTRTHYLTALCCSLAQKKKRYNNIYLCLGSLGFNLNLGQSFLPIKQRNKVKQTINNALDFPLIHFLSLLPGIGTQWSPKTLPEEKRIDE